MSSLLSLCDELLHEVFAHVTPSDLVSLARTCKTFDAYIKGNNTLWRDSYFVNYVRIQERLVQTNRAKVDLIQDYPLKPEEIGDWEQELRDIGRMQRVLRSDDVEFKVSTVRYPSTPCSLHGRETTLAWWPAQQSISSNEPTSLLPTPQIFVSSSNTSKTPRIATSSFSPRHYTATIVMATSLPAQTSNSHHHHMSLGS